jgi:hypothetical protein
MLGGHQDMQNSKLTWCPCHGHSVADSTVIACAPVL